MKCEKCKIMNELYESKEPACCAWYMDNVVLGNKSVEDCGCCEDINVSYLDDFMKMGRY